MAATHSTWTTPTAHIRRGDWVEEGDERVAYREMTLHFLVRANIPGDAPGGIPADTESTQ